MAEIVNLRTVRKQRTRAEKDSTAATNRVLHGRTKAERKRDESTRTQDIRHLDGHKLDGHKLDPGADPSGEA